MVLRLQSFFDEKPLLLDHSKNPYLKSLQSSRGDTQRNLYFGSDLKEVKGRWRSLLGLSETSSLILEIGCHKGLTLTQMAQDHSDIGFLGLDITFKRVVTTSERLKGLSHAGVIYGQAQNLREIFDPCELSGVILFFPDPWNKKKSQRHHRLLNPEFAAMAHELLDQNGFFWFKTDAHDYFLEGVEALSQFPFQESQLPLKKNYVTTFQRKFALKNLPYWEGVWRKNV